MLPESISHGVLKSEDEHRRDICTVGLWFHQRGYVAATDGNISLRLSPHRVLASPTNICKGMMSPDDLVITDLGGDKISGRRNASSELAMHLLIYKRRPDVNAIVHAHPPTATGYAAAGLPLNKALISEVVLSFGCIPLARYGTPGTPELTEALAPLVASYDAILMANHGVVTCGPDLMRAYFKMETVEHFAKISLVTEILGRQVLLSESEVDKLLSARQRYFGSATPAFERTSACPVSDGGGETAARYPEGSRDSQTSGSRRCEPERFTVSHAELVDMVREAVAKARTR